MNLSKNIFAALKRLVRDEEGTEVVEWALVAGLIVVLAAGTFALIGDDVNTVFQGIQAQTGAAAANVPAAPAE